MARRKTKPCEFCEMDWTHLPSAEDDNRLSLDLYPGHGISAVAILYNRSTEEDFEDSVTIPMDFCPACGRDLRM